MDRKSWLCGTVGVVAFLLLSRGIAFADGEEGEKGEKDKRMIRYAIVQVEDEAEKHSFEVVDMRTAHKWINHRIKQGEKRREEWKALPREERKRTPEPERVKARIKKTNLKTEEEGKAYAERLLARIPENRRAEAPKAEEGKNRREKAKEKRKEGEKEKGDKKKAEEGGEKD